MNINLANNPFVLPPNRSEIAEINPVRPSNRLRDAAVQIQNVDNQASTNQTVTPQTKQNDRFFTLNSRQSRQLSDLQSRDSARSDSNNSSISKYLETQNLARREEIESLVGLDVFV